MKRRSLDQAVEYIDCDDVKKSVARVDETAKGARGPAPLVGARTIIGGLVYLSLEQKPMHLKTLWRELSTATAKELRRLGLNRTPSYRQLCLGLERMLRCLSRGEGFEQRVQGLLDELVPASAGECEETTIWAVDTTLYDGWCRWVANGDRCSDPDAKWRVIEKPGGTKNVLGYGALALVRADGGVEVCDRVALFPANAEDSDIAADMCQRANKDGLGIERVLADRGFSQKPERFQRKLYEASIHCTFDLKSNDIGRSGDFYGAVVIDGWPHSPGIPQRLIKVPKPGLNATRQEKSAYNAAITERQRWAFKSHARPRPGRARVASPVKRGSVNCSTSPGSRAPAQAPTCRATHDVNEGCGLGVKYFGFENAPRTYQYPVFGTTEWSKLYAKRSCVERFFGKLKEAEGVGFTRGRFRIRGLAKMAIFLAAAVASTNLLLREPR